MPNQWNLTNNPFVDDDFTQIGSDVYTQFVCNVFKLGSGN